MYEKKGSRTRVGWDTGEHWCLQRGRGGWPVKEPARSLTGAWREQCHESQARLSHGEINKKAQHAGNSCIFWALTAYQSLWRFRHCVSFDPWALEDASEVRRSHGTYQGHRASWRDWDLNPGRLGYKAHVLNSAGVTELFRMQPNIIVIRNALDCFSKKQILKTIP